MEAITRHTVRHVRGQQLFEGVERLHHEFLSWMIRMVRAPEIESCTADEWQRAAPEGYRALRLLKDHGGEVLTFGTVARALRYRITAPLDN